MSWRKSLVRTDQSVRFVARNLMFMRIILLILFIVASWSIHAQDRPKLVVGIIADQMRQEYLYRFEKKFGDGGFRRLMSDGFMLKNANYSYVPTYTGPGHASVYTGTTPAV